MSVNRQMLRAIFSKASQLNLFVRSGAEELHFQRSKRNAQGWYDPNRRSITINTAKSDNSPVVPTLYHELGHAIQGGTEEYCTFDPERDAWKEGVALARCMPRSLRGSKSEWADAQIMHRQRIGSPYHTGKRGGKFYKASSGKKVYKK